MNSTKTNDTVERSYSVDPLSDLVSATEMRVWRNHPTTKKVMRYLKRYRQEALDSLSEGESLSASADASAMKTTEFVAKCQLLKDITELEARDVAEFYNLAEPAEEKKK